MKLPRELTLNTDARLRIGDFLVNPATQQLQRAESGAVIHLERSSFDLLLCLASRPGEVISKDALLQAVWPGRVVSENSLSQAVRKLRTALGDGGGEAIQLVRGFGYRLALPVSASARSDEPTEPGPGLPRRAALQSEAASASPGVSAKLLSTRPRAIWAGGLITLLLVASSAGVVAWRQKPEQPTVTTQLRQLQELRNTLAVLPFVDLSAGGLLAREALLLSDGLRKDCHRIPQLHVTSESRTRAFAGSVDDAEAVLAGLDADLVLSGSLRSEGRGFELELRLTDHSGQGLGFVRRYPHALGDLGEFQRQLRFEVYKVLGNTAERWGGERPEQRGTANHEAWLAFVRAASLLGDNEEGQRRAKAALELAVDLDPNYAEAWIALGSVLGAGGGTGGLYADNGEELAEGRRRAMAALDRGISLAPDVPGNYLLRSEIRHLYFYDWAGAVADLDRAEALLPKPTAHYFIQRARMAASLGDLSAALEFDDRATALDAESGSLRNKGWHLIALGRHAEARALLLQELEVRPFESSLNFYLGLCDLYEGLPDAALRRFEHAATVHRLTGSVLAHVRRGDRASAGIALQSLETRFADTAAYEIAIGHAWLGDRDQAFQWLDHAIKVGDGGMLYLKFDPLLESLRSDPRYLEMLRRIAHPAAA